MRRFWPTAAAACCVARSVGRESSFRNGIPVAIAPDETSTTSAPRACALARASTSGPIWPALAPLIDDDPTLTTMREARGMSARERTSLTCRAFILRGRGCLFNGKPFIVVPDAGRALGLQLGAGG